MTITNHVDARSIVEALGGTWHGSYGSARCPAHNDTRPSLSVSDGEKQAIVVKCHTGCENKDVITALSTRGLWPESEPFVAPTLQAPNGNGHATDDDEDEDPLEAYLKTHDAQPAGIAETYPYRDENNHDVFETVRYIPKDFKQRHRGPHNEWIWNLKGVRRVLYRLPELIAADKDAWVFIPAGEKDVDRLRSLGLVSTTNPLGEGKWDVDYNEWLRGRTVVLLQDNDETGAKHVERVRDELRGIAVAVWPLLLPNLPEKGDVSDWLDAGGNAELLYRLAENARPKPPVVGLAEFMAESTTMDSQLVEGILWANRTTWIFASAGTGKTLFSLALGLHIAAGKPFLGRKVIQGPVLLIEEDSPFSSLRQYVQELADIYQIDLAAIPFYINREQGLRVMDDAGLERAKELILSCPQEPILVLMDAAERLAPSDKYNSKELDPLVRLIQWMLNRMISPVIIDHTRRVPPKDVKETNPIDLLFGGLTKRAIADIMMWFSGSFRTGGVRVTYAKFRGETPASFDLKFTSDEGFQVIDVPTNNLTPSEQKITRFINNNPSRWYTKQEICDGAGVPEGTARRSLPALVTRRWLVSDGDEAGAGRGNEARYKANHDAKGPFDA